MSKEETLNVKSIDDGYGDFKYDSLGTPALIPSFVTSFKTKPEDTFSRKNNLKYLASEVKGKRYVIGDYAMKLDPSIKWTLSENKHDSPNFPVLLKTVLGTMSNSSHEVIDSLMMNLPIKYDTPDRRDNLTKIAQGTHEVSISTDGVNFIQKVITVKSVDIKKQPFGSLCDIILDDSGELKERKIAKGFNVIADIGARTLNLLTVEALEEQPELSIHTNDGMYVAFTQVGKYLESGLGGIIPDGKLPGIIEAGEMRGKDITPIIQHVYENHANNILTAIESLLMNSSVFVDNLIFTGGGSELLKPYLKSPIKEVNTIFLDRFANVRGLRKYGLRQARKKGG